MKTTGFSNKTPELGVHRILFGRLLLKSGEISEHGVEESALKVHYYRKRVNRWRKKD